MNTALRVLLVLVLAPGVLLACAPAQPPQAAPKPAPQQQATFAQIKAMIGPAGCTAATQCASLPVGATPCGSPEGYLPWSSSHSDPKALLALAERHKAERQAAHAASGMLSDCRQPRDPGATCDLARGVCIAPASLPAVPASAR
jgi:hypothetical protein